MTLLIIGIVTLARCRLNKTPSKKELTPVHISAYKPVEKCVTWGILVHHKQLVWSSSAADKPTLTLACCFDFEVLTLSISLPCSLYLFAEATSALGWNLLNKCVSRPTSRWSARICTVKTPNTLRCPMECWTTEWYNRDKHFLTLVYSDARKHLGGNHNTDVLWIVVSLSCPDDVLMIIVVCNICQTSIHCNETDAGITVLWN